jgi:tetratricopeptide (TPR) repeat protein
VSAGTGSALARAQALLDLRRFDDAAQLLGQAIAQDPEDVWPRCELGRALIGAERWDEALAAAEAATALAPEFDWPHRLRALALNGLGRTKEAVRASEEAVRLDADDATNWQVLASCRLMAKDVRGAREAAERGLQLDPEDADLHRTVGDVALERDEVRAAERHYRRALELDPEDPVALNNLGVVLLRSDRKGEASELFEAAARLDPGLDVTRENVGASARSHVNGGWFLLVGSFLALQTVRAALAGNVVLAILLAAGGGTLFLVYREGAKARWAELSPAAQRLLDDQSWAERVELRQWRPWFWLIPSPIWFALGLVVLVAAGIEIGNDGLDASGAVAVAALVAFCVLTGRRAVRYVRRKGWWGAS